MIPSSKKANRFYAIKSPLSIIWPTLPTQQYWFARRVKAADEDIIKFSFLVS